MNYRIALDQLAAMLEHWLAPVCVLALVPSAFFCEAL